jgi:hypothetical protein
MKSVISFLVLFLALPAGAVCHSVFSFGGQGNIAIGSPSVGGDDGDALALWNAMNVPEQGSFLGPGKNIKTARQEMSFVCGQRGAGVFNCSIVLNKKAQGAEAIYLDPVQKRMAYKVSGERARELAKQFHLNNQGFEFFSSDSKLWIKVQPDLFELRYADSGL